MSCVSAPPCARLLGCLVWHSNQTSAYHHSHQHRTQPPHAPKKEIPISPACKASTPHVFSPAGIASEDLPTAINLKRRRYGCTAVLMPFLEFVPLRDSFSRCSRWTFPRETDLDSAIHCTLSHVAGRWIPRDSRKLGKAKSLASKALRRRLESWSVGERRSAASAVMATCDMRPSRSRRGACDRTELRASRQW